MDIRMFSTVDTDLASRLVNQRSRLGKDLWPTKQGEHLALLTEVPSHLLQTQSELCSTYSTSATINSGTEIPQWI